MAGRPWTSEEFEFIKNGHHKKVAISEMALKIGRSEPSIRHKLKELGLTKRQLVHLCFLEAGLFCQTPGGGHPEYKKLLC